MAWHSNSKTILKEFEILSNELNNQPKDPTIYKKLFSEWQHREDGQPYFETISGYKNIKTLNGCYIPSDLYRYISYQRFVSDLKQNSLCFISPRLWEDPFEKRFLETDYSTIGYTQPQTFCLCTTTEPFENEDAAWKLYCRNNDKPLRIKFKFDSLLEALDNFAEKAKGVVIITPVDYDFSRKEIELLHTDVIPFYQKQFFPQSFQLENYISLLSLKRSAFKYENEVRIFIEINNTNNTTQNIIQIPYSYEDGLQEITIGPLWPYGFDDPRSLHYKYLNDIDYCIFSEQIHSWLKNIKINKSELYCCETLMLH